MDFKITRVFNISIIVSFIFALISIDFINPRMFPFEKGLKAVFFLVTIVAIILSSKKIKFTQPLAIITFLYLFYFAIGLSRGEGIRNIGAALVLYGQPILIYLYFISNPEIADKTFKTLLKLKPFFLLLIFLGIFYVFLSTGELRRYEATNPILFTLAALALTRNFNISNFLFLVLLFYICFNSGIRFTLFQLFLSLALSFIFAIRMGEKSFTEISFSVFIILFIISLLYAFGYDALLETRFRTLLGLSSISFYDLLESNEYSTLTRLLEYNSIMQFIDNKNIFNIIFGHGFGATYPLSNELMFLSQLSGGSYESVVRENGYIHNIHNGLLSIFFRCGIIGLVLYLLIIFDVLKTIFTTRNKDIVLIAISTLCLISADMFYSQLQTSISILLIPMYFYVRNKKFDNLKSF